MLSVSQGKDEPPHTVDLSPYRPGAGKLPHEPQHAKPLLLITQAQSHPEAQFLLCHCPSLISLWKIFFAEFPPLSSSTGAPTPPPNSNVPLCFQNKLICLSWGFKAFPPLLEMGSLSRASCNGLGCLSTLRAPPKPLQYVGDCHRAVSLPAPPDLFVKVGFISPPLLPAQRSLLQMGG